MQSTDEPTAETRLLLTDHRWYPQTPAIPPTPPKFSLQINLRLESWIETVRTISELRQ